MADSIDDATQLERQQSLQRMRSTIDSYQTDTLGAYTAAEKNAYNNALPDGVIVPALGKGSSLASVAASAAVGTGVGLVNIGKRNDYQFIQKVRSIANNAYQDRQNQEVGRFQQAYNLNKPPTGPMGSFIDIPVRIIDSLGRDIGLQLGNAQTTVQKDATTIFGSSGAMFPGINAADQYVNSGLNDISNAPNALIARIVTESPWLGKAAAALNSKGNLPIDINKISSFMGGINNIYKSSTNKLFGNLGDILNAWWHDPKTLCCLIKSLAALAVTAGKKIQNAVDPNKKTDTSGESFSTAYNQIITKYFNGNGKADLTELTGTSDFFDKMIAILKIVRSFLAQDLNFNFALNIDLGLSMSKASIGALMALLTALQQMLQDKIYAKMMSWVNEYVGSGLRQCLPFEQLLRLIAQWMTGPDGIFKYIEQYVNAYMIGFQTNTQYGFNEADKIKMMDLASLDKLIDLLSKLRDAMLNMELCIEADFNQPNASTIPGIPTNDKSVGIAPGNYSDLVNQIRGNTTGLVTYPTDREVTAFLTNRLGESSDFAQQVLASAKQGANLSGLSAGSPDNAGGGSDTANLVSAIGDCANTLNSSRIESLANLIAGWEII